TYGNLFDILSKAVLSCSVEAQAELKSALEQQASLSGGGLALPTSFFPMLGNLESKASEVKERKVEVSEIGVRNNSTLPFFSRSTILNNFNNTSSFVDRNELEIKRNFNG
ncbi:MAG: hypothetical protein JO131_03355, partial [Gammaproteobacteria bacterium]|nr:hypothetical protein [Gammaproteobacteria bacterium]